MILPLKIMSAQTNRRDSPLWLSDEGFSIIELLVVVIVIAVLAAIAFPKYNKAVDETHRREAKTVLGIIRSAEMAYKIDTDKYSPVSSLTANNVAADEARSVLNIDIYDNDDWAYIVGVNSDSSTATATAVRKRGYSTGNVLMDMTTGDSW